MTKKNALSIVFALALISFACGKKTDNPKTANADTAAMQAQANQSTSVQNANSTATEKTTVAAVDLETKGYPSKTATISKVENPQARLILDNAIFSPKGLKAIFATPEKMSSDEYEALVLARGKCLIDAQTGRPRTCPVGRNQDLRRLYEGRTIPADQKMSVLERLLGHDDPKIRSAAVEEILIDATRLNLIERRSRIDALISKIRNESDINVLKSILTYAGNARDSRAFRDWQVSLINHSSDEVRMGAVSGEMAARMSADEIPAYRSALLQRLSDSPLIAQRACDKLGKVATPEDISILENHLKLDEDKLIQAGCFRSLVTMWSHRGGEEMKPAYTATISYLMRTPRSQNFPAYTAITSLPGKDLSVKLKEKESYYQEDMIIKALSLIATDKAVDPLVSAEAISKLADLEATGSLKLLSDSIRKNTNPHVLNAYESALKKVHLK